MVSFTDVFDPAIAPYAITFLFVFAIVLGLLTKANIFKGHKGVNAAIAAVFGIFSAMYEPMVLGMRDYIPYASIVLVLIFFAVLIKELFKGKGDGFDALPMVLTLGILLLIIGVLWNELSAFVPVGVDQTGVLWIIGLIIIVLIFIGVYKHSTKG